MTGKTKRRASSPAQRPSPPKAPRTGDGSPSKPSRSLSALAPAFVPRPQPSPAQQTSTQSTLTPAFRPLFKSEPIQAKDSTFQARLFRLENPAHRNKILAFMKKHHSDAQHHMAAWRCLILKDGMTGLEGPHAFIAEAGCCDDGESRGGKTVMDVLEKSGLSDVLVVVSRRFGGTMLGPARFTYITDCARAVCTAMYEQEKAQERASQVADLVAQLREWDTEVADLRTQIAILDAKSKQPRGEIKALEKAPGDQKPDPENRPHGQKEGGEPSVIVSLKPPDYTSVLNPPDVEKAERLLQARRKTVQSLKALLEKRRQEPIEETQQRKRPESASSASRQADTTENEGDQPINHNL